MGDENFFLFGHMAEEIEMLARENRSPMYFFESNSELQEINKLITSGLFSRGDTTLFKPLLDTLLRDGLYFTYADSASYFECQERVAEKFGNEDGWARMSILNVARMGWFSSDRSVREYCNDIWNVSPVPVPLKGSDGLEFLESIQ